MKMKIKGELRYQRLFWFLLVNFFITLFLGRFFLDYTVPPESFGEFVFLYLALTSNFLLIYLIVGLFLLVITAIIPSTLFMMIVSTITLLSVNLFILIDFNIFKLFRFHINSLIWNALVTEGSGEKVQLGTGSWITFSIIAFVILVIEIGFHYYLAMFRNKPFFQRSFLKKFLLVSLLCLLVILMDKGIYAYADLYNRTSITRYAKVFPLYQPLTIKRFAKKKLGFVVNREFELEHQKKGKSLNYPLEQLTFSGEKPKFNIVMIIIESWRYDMLGTDVTPEIYSFSENAYVFSNHYSGGNASRFGIFSIFYGIYGSYWHHFLGEREGPILISSLKELGYEFKILASSPLTFPEFRKTCFVEITEYIEDKLDGSNAIERDQQQVFRFHTWIDSRDSDKPFFTVFFLDGPHAPYSYPDNFAKFKPAVKDLNFIRIDKRKNALPYLNDYKNAIYFDDWVTGKILNVLKERRLLDSTIVFISGDHGQEFWERGFWGHNGAFSPEQVKVPMIVHLPGESGRTIDWITSHYDIPSTILSLLGCNTPVENYSLGYPIFSDEKRSEYIVSVGWDECAVIDSSIALVFSTESYNISKFEVRDKDYNIILKTDPYLKSRISTLTEVILNMSKFLK